MKNKKQIILITICLICFIIITILYYLNRLNDFDNLIYHFIYQFHSKNADAFFKTITKFGNSIPVLLITLFLGLVLKEKNRIFLLSSMIITFLTNQAIKFIVARPRPPIERRLIKQGGYSFPSGHSMMSLCLYGFLVYFVYKKVNNKLLKIILILLLTLIILLIGISRIYVGVHFPSDVLSGYILSLGLLIGDITYVNHLFKGETNNDKNVSN